MAVRQLIHRVTVKIRASVLTFGLAALGVALAVALAVAIANISLLPLRVYLTGTVTTSVIDQCRVVELGGEPGTGPHDANFVRTRGSDSFILVDACDPKSSGQPVTVISSKIADKTVGVTDHILLIGIYFALDGSAGTSFIFALLLGCGLTLYRTATIFRFASKEFRTAWAPLTFSKGDRWKSMVKGSELLTDFLFLGLIIGSIGIVVYAMFRTLLYMQHGGVWFSALAIIALAIIWSSAPLKVVALAWKGYRTPLFTILRNLVSGLLMLGSIRTIYKMPAGADLASLQGFVNFVVAVVRASIGLDVN